MSYSFSARAATIAAALAAVAEKFDAVVAQQPAHAADRDLVLKAAEGAAAVIAPDDDSTDVSISCSGSLSGQWADGQYTSITTCSVNVTAMRSPRAAA